MADDQRLKDAQAHVNLALNATSTGNALEHMGWALDAIIQYLYWNQPLKPCVPGSSD